MKFLSVTAQMTLVWALEGFCFKNSHPLVNFYLDSLFFLDYTYSVSRRSSRLYRNLTEMAEQVNHKGK